jgi:hypothetical protein
LDDRQAAIPLNSTVAVYPVEVHTSPMSLKDAALFALVGTDLLTLVLLAGLARDVWGVVNGVVPAIRLLTSLIHALAGVSLAVFFYVFHKAQG